MVHFRIHINYSGFPVEVEFDGEMDKLDAIVERLYVLGATPPEQQHVHGNGAGTNGAATGSVEPPVCPYHGPMKPSKFGGWHCTARMGDGSYCKEKAK